MSRLVSQTQITTARDVDLTAFLLNTYPMSFDWDAETDALIYRSEHPVQVGMRALHFENTVFAGNPIDFLMRNFGYNFVDAVKILSRYARQTGVSKAGEIEKTSATSSDKDPYVLPIPDREKEFCPPERESPPFRRLFGFLRNQRIPYETGKRVVCQGLLYQEPVFGNAVFLNKSKDFFEVMGTLSFAKTPYYACERKEDDTYWSVRNSADKPKRICICSTALDAVSLMELQRQAGMDVSAAYVSVGMTRFEPAVLKIILNARQISASVFLALPEKNMKQMKHTTAMQATAVFTSPSNSWSEDLRTNIRFRDPVYAP